MGAHPSGPRDHYPYSLRLCGGFLMLALPLRMLCVMSSTVFRAELRASCPHTYQVLPGLCLPGGLAGLMG